MATSPIRHPDELLAVEPATGYPSDTHIVRPLTVLLFTCIAVRIILPLFSHQSWTTLVQDDFFYYLVIAQNIVHGYGSTFNRLVATNGYQPLWLWVITALSFFTSNPKVILGFLAVSDFAASVATFLLSYKLIRRTGVRPLLVFALTTLVTVTSLALFYKGMEVTVTVPVMLAVLYLFTDLEWLERSASHTFLFGLLLSAMVLSRIDTLILGFLLLAGVLLSGDLRRRLRPALWLGLLAGLLPVLLYFVSNHIFFGVWFPISGMAKQIKFSARPSLMPFESLVLHPSPPLLIFFVVLLGAFATYPGIAKRLKPAEQVGFLAVLSFPFVYYAALSFISDWSLWAWYWYPLRTGLCVSFVFFCLAIPASRYLQKNWVCAVLVLAGLSIVALQGWTRTQLDIDEAGRDVRSFSTTHHGIYAMGDRSGRVGYMIADPLVQTEGLVMDRKFLDYLKAQVPLRVALRAYNVRYYIATAYKPFTGCFEAAEPYQAGALSAHMRDEFCEAPVARFQEHTRQTLIFDLDPQAPANAAASSVRPAAASTP